MTKVPRFGIKSLLIGFTVVALWLVSSLAILSDDRVGDDLRVAILLFIFVASGSAAICCEGWKRAYWAGFSCAMLMTVAKVPGFSVQLEWLDVPIGQLVGLFPGDQNSLYRIYKPLLLASQLACILAISSFAGLIATYIYNQRRPQK